MEHPRIPSLEEAERLFMQTYREQTARQENSGQTSVKKKTSQDVGKTVRFELDAGKAVASKKEGSPFNHSLQNFQQRQEQSREPNNISQNKRDVVTLDKPPVKNTAVKRLPAGTSKCRDKEDIRASENPEKLLDDFDVKTSIVGVLSSIREHEVKQNTRCQFLPSVAKAGLTSGFPETFDALCKTAETDIRTKGDENASKSKMKKKQSLFLQMMRRNKANDDLVTETGTEDRIQSGENRKGQLNDLPSILGSKLRAATGFSHNDLQQIHRENVNLLSGMTNAEIDHARTEILGRIDPALLARLNKSLELGFRSDSRDAEKAFSFSQEKNESETRTTQCTTVDSKSTRETACNIQNGVLERINNIDWANVKTEEDLFETSRKLLPQWEREKLVWTGEMKEEDEPEADASEGDVDEIEKRWRASWQTVRFDLHGQVAVDDGVYRSELHHHGQDHEQPGYTVPEMFRLARSTVDSQRLTAFRMLAAILKDRHDSLYSYANPRRHPLFALPNELVTILRYGLDDVNRKVVKAALEAMAAYVVPQVHHRERLEIEAVSPTNNLASADIWAQVARAQGDSHVFGRKNDDAAMAGSHKEITDDELCELSPIQGMLRMGVVHRIAFLVRSAETLDDDEFGFCLEILTVVAIHGKSSLSKITSHPSLMQVVVRRSFNHGRQSFITAVRFFRTLMRAGSFPLSWRGDEASSVDLLDECVEVFRGDSDYETRLECLLTIRMAILRGCAIIPDSFLSLLIDIVKNSTELNPSLLDVVFNILSLLGVGTDDICDKALQSLVSNADRVIQPGAVRFLSIRCYREWCSSMNDESIRVDSEHILSRVPDSDSEQRKENVDVDVDVDVGVDSTERSPSRTIADAISCAFMNALVSTKLPDLGKILLSIDDIVSIRNLDKVHAWTNGVRNCARIPCCRGIVSGSPQALAQLEAVVESAKQLNNIVKSMTLSPKTAFHVRTLLYAGVDAVETLAFLNCRRNKWVTRVSDLVSLVPVYLVFQGDEWIASVLLGALGSRNLSRRKNTPENRSPKSVVSIFRALIGHSAIESSYARVSNISGNFVKSLAIGRIEPDTRRKKAGLWTSCLSAWPLVPLLIQATDVSTVHATLEFAKQLPRECMKSADLVVLFIRFSNQTNSDILFDTAVSADAEVLLVPAVGKLLEEKTWRDTLSKSAGGRSRLFDLYMNLIRAYNERLVGHAIPTTCLLLAMRLDSDVNLRRLVWSELLSGNLLRLLVPPRELTSILHINCINNEESNREVLECMITAVAKRALSKENNLFLYEFVMENLRRYIWKNTHQNEQLSWERKDALERVILGSSSKDIYADLCKVAQDQHGTSSLEDDRLDIIKNMARSQYELAKKLAKDGLEF